MTIVPQKNPFPNTKIASTAEKVYSPFVVKQNKGAGPKGQTSNMQIKKVPFKGLKQYNPHLKQRRFYELTKRSMVTH